MGSFPSQGERKRADPSLSFTGQDPEQLATIKSYLQPNSDTEKSSLFHAHGRTAVLQNTSKSYLGWAGQIKLFFLDPGCCACYNVI